MPEIGTSGLMSGDGKRGVGHRPQATAPILDSTKCEVPTCVGNVCSRGNCGRDVLALSLTGFSPQQTWCADSVYEIYGKFGRTVGPLYSALMLAARIILSLRRMVEFRSGA